MELIIEQETNQGRLILKDDLTIDRIRDIHEIMCQSLSAVESLVIDIQDAAQIDLTFLQLLCSAHRTATASNKSIVLSGQINPVMEKAVEDHCFARGKGCGLDKTNTCLWMVKENE